ncbi:MAG: hypothetical protein J5529_01305 [Prevotella sp.]|nr:hypothetical protein [Prevotella sp.]
MATDMRQEPSCYCLGAANIRNSIHTCKHLSYYFSLFISRSKVQFQEPVATVGVDFMSIRSPDRANVRADTALIPFIKASFQEPVATVGVDFMSIRSPDRANVRADTALIPFIKASFQEPVATVGVDFMSIRSPIRANVRHDAPI